MRTPKENKQKLRDRTPKSTAGTIPKAALKAAWLKTKEQTRTAARENDTDTRQQEPTDLAGSAAEQSAAFVRHQGRKLAETQARQHRQKEAVARAHAAGERGVSPKQTEYGTLPDAAQRPRRGADLPRQRAKEKAITAKTAPRDIRGVTQGQRQLHTAANETVRSVMTQAQMQTHAQKIRLAVQKAVGGTGRTAVAVHSAIRNFLAELHSFITVLAAGAGAALGIVIVICLVAFVISMIVHYAAYRESVLDIVMVNTLNPYEESVSSTDEFFEQEGFTKKEEVTVDTSITFSDDDNYSTNYYSNQKLTLKLSVGGADVLFAPEFVFQQYADAGSLMPLTDYLTADELEQYKDMIVYATDSETGETLPCGLELNDNQWLSDYGYYTGTVCFGIAYATDNKGNAVDFFHYVMN